MNIRDYIRKKKLLCDGAFGTYFASLNGDIMAEKANTADRETVFRVHRAYIEKGAELIRTNTFESGRKSLNCTEEELAENISAAYDIAVKAAGNSVFVACDIGPSCEEDFYIIADTFIDKGAEIILFETFPDLSPIENVIRHIKTRNPDIFIIVQFCINQHGYTSEGISASRLMERADAMAEIDAMGFNCGIGPSHLLNVLKNLNIKTDKFITALPNASYPSVIQDRMVFLDNVNYYSEKMAEISDYADIIGGCCGTNPEYTGAMAERIDFDREFAPHRPAFCEKTPAESSGSPSNVFFADKKEGEKIIAVELDPPKDGNSKALMETANYLRRHNADVITFADSPSGRTRADSVLMSIKVAQETGMNVMPHICCRDKNAIGISSQLLGAYINNVRNFLVITGDPVPSTSRDNIKGVFNFDSVRLMDYIGDMNRTMFSKDRVSYGGAINYARRNMDTELKRIRLKEEAGAEFFLTQPVYDDRDIDTLKSIKSGLRAKMLVGIMPLVSYTNALFIKNELTGINVPDAVVERFSPSMTRKEAQRTGIEIAEEIMDKVHSFADGFYFTIPFNRLSIAEELLRLAEKY